MQQGQVEDTVVDDIDDEDDLPPSRASRVMWGIVFFLAAMVLLGVVTLASVALLSPDAWTGPCKRPQLVRPEACSSVSNFGG